MDSPLIDRPGEHVDDPHQSHGHSEASDDRADRPPTRVVWAVLSWPLLAMVAFVLLLRWQGTDRSFLLAIVGLTPALVVPVTLGAIAAWRSRSTILRIASAALALLFLVAVNPTGAIVGCGGEQAEDAITIYSANVLSEQGRPDEIAASVEAAGADVVVLQEASYDFLIELAADPRVASLAHRSEDLTGHGLGRTIWSRWPLSDVRVEPFVAADTVSATIESPQGPFRLVNIHTLAPINDPNLAMWQEQYRVLERVPTDVPGVLAGDFNATEHHREFRELRSGDWTDVHEPRGCGFFATWPVDRITPFPFYRLDHMLVTDHFEILDLRTGDPGGSDHLPLVADIRLTQPQLGSSPVDDDR